jgi:hypothetical protein
MSYQTGEAAILSLIQALDGFDADSTLSLANDSTRQAEGLLNSGRSDCYVNLRPGVFSRVYADIGASEVHTVWQTVIAIYALNASGQGPEKALVEARQAILDQLSAHLQLGSSAVLGINGFSGGEVGSRAVADDTFIVQEVRVEWMEVGVVAQAD